MSTLFKIIIISPEREVQNETDIVADLFKYDLQFFHLRKPGKSETEMAKYLDAIPPEFHSRIVLHSNFNLIKKYKVKGIHLSEENKKNIEKLKEHEIISASFHSLEDLRNNTFPYEYVLLSPVFDSISKQGYKSGFDLNVLKENISSLKKEKSIPELIALGGVNQNNISSLKEMGFFGAALLGAVWESDDPVRAFRQIQSKIQ